MVETIQIGPYSEMTSYSKNFYFKVQMCCKKKSVSKFNWSTYYNCSDVVHHQPGILNQCSHLKLYWLRRLHHLPGVDLVRDHPQHHDRPKHLPLDRLQLDTGRGRQCDQWQCEPVSDISDLSGHLSDLLDQSGHLLHLLPHLEPPSISGAGVCGKVLKVILFGIFLWTINFYHKNELSAISVVDRLIRPVWWEYFDQFYRLKYKFLVLPWKCQWQCNAVGQSPYLKTSMPTNIF